VFPSLAGPPMRRARHLCEHLAASPSPPMTIEELRHRYGKTRPGLEFSGVNHVAWVCSDMQRTVEFWCGALGLKLTKTIQMPGGGQHFFMDGGRSDCSLAYFWFPDAPPQQAGIATVDVQKMMRTGSFATAHGSVNHVAWNVPQDKLREYRHRVKKSGMWCSPILYHTDETESGFEESRSRDTTWESFYFTGPDGEYCEMTAQTQRFFTPKQDILHLPRSSNS